METTRLKPGTRVEHHTIIEFLKSGGYGAVYLARDETCAGRVALKALHPHLAADPANVERFQREAQEMAKLQHSNIVQVYYVSYDRVNDLHYFTMEYMPNGSLEDMIKKRLASGTTIKEERMLEIMRQVLAGLGYAHIKGRIHRDIKPSNILRSENRFALADFGLVKRLDSNAAHDITEGDIFGTPKYMSPEQINGEALDERTDLYSIGIVMYEMLTGKAPFDGRATTQILMQQLNTKPPKIQGLGNKISAGSMQLVNRLLEKKAKDRPRTTEGVLGAMAVLPSNDQKLKRPLLAGVAMLMLLVAGAAWWIYRNPIGNSNISTPTPAAQLTQPLSNKSVNTVGANSSGEESTLGGLEVGGNGDGNTPLAVPGALNATPKIGATPTLAASDTPTSAPVSTPSNSVAQKATPVPSGSFSAPSILSPANDQYFGGGDMPTLKWSSAGLLGSSQYYRVSIKHSKGWDVMCVKETQTTPNTYVRDIGTQDDRFTWTVDVVNATGTPNANRSCTGSAQALSSASSSVFKWSKLVENPRVNVPCAYPYPGGCGGR